MEDIVGKMLDNNRYEVLQIIGVGAFGTVLSAIDWRSNEVVALKELFFDNDELTKSMIREIYLQTEMAHPNIVGLQRVFIQHEKKCMYLVMEHLEDDLKSHRVKAKEEFEHPETIKLTMKQIIEGVHYLHSQGVIHRDLKPENILIDPVNDRLKIADLGCARSNIYLNNLTPKGTTLGYRAPEVIRGQQYAASIDMWSIGCVFSEVVTGAPLFLGRTEGQVLGEICSLFGIEDSDACTSTTEVAFPFSMHYEVLNNAGRDLLTKLLQPNPERRISVEEAINHEYLKD